MRRVLGGLFGLLLLLPGWRTTAQDGLWVDAGQELGAISPYSYGSNHGPWAAVPYELLPAADAAGLTFLRFPGGNWGDLNNLSPRHVDDFIALCRRMGAEPSISVRLRNGGTPEAAAELVRYTNIEKGYGVRYWSIGNEPNLYPDYDTVMFNQEWRTIAEAMRAIDPSILLLGPELSQYPPDFASTPKDRAGRDWLSEFLSANGDLVDVVTVHRYPFPQERNRATTIEELRANPPEWDAIIPNLRGIIREVSGRDLPIGITEVNSHWNSAYGLAASPDSFYNALWWADVLGRLIQQRVDIVAHWTLQSPNAFGGWGLLGQFDDIRPSYYIYQLYQQFGTTLLVATSTEPEVSLTAARRQDDALTLMIVNLSATDKNLPLHIAHFEAAMAEVWRFDAEHNAALLGTESLGERLHLPAQSVTLLVIHP